MDRNGLMRIFGCILAGGQSRRMGGGDKTLALLQGRPVLAHIIARLQPQVAGLFLNANGDPARFAPFGLEVVADTLPGWPGPLAGVLAALEHAAGKADWVATVSGDTPFIPLDFVARLLQASGGERCAAARSPSGDHPVCALWPVSLAPQLRDAAENRGVARVMQFLAAVNAAPAEFPDAPDRTGTAADPFFNINTPEDLARAEMSAPG